MRKWMLLGTLVMCSSIAQADITVKIFSQTEVPTGWLWTYEATLSPDARIEGGVGPADYFTIYDFAGYVDGSISTDLALAPGWVGSVDATGGDVPGQLPGDGDFPADSPLLLNLIFTYTGAARIEGGGVGASLGLFSAVSDFGPGEIQHDSSYVGQSTNNTGVVGADGRTLGNIGTVVTPEPPGDVIPEPGTMGLLGSALLGLGVLRWRRN